MCVGGQWTVTFITMPEFAALTYRMPPKTEDSDIPRSYLYNKSPDHSSKRLALSSRIKLVNINSWEKYVKQCKFCAQGPMKDSIFHFMMRDHVKPCPRPDF